IDPDKATKWEITPTFGYSSTSSASNLSEDNIYDYTTGFEHEFQKGTTSNLSSTTNYGITGLYVHAFKKPRRNVSIQMGISHSITKANGGSDKDYKYYADSTE